MKKLNFIIGTLILSIGLTGCSSAYYASSGYDNDDLYALHDKTAIARKQQAVAEARKAEAEARRAEWEAKIAEAQAAAAQNGYYEGSSSNPYNDILADDYESAYARRLRGFESPTYRMPSSYSNFRYGSSFTYATAYDPAFYNIIISGDEVWVEPKYITSMFGSWGGTPYGGWYFGWNYSPSWWGYPSYAWGGWNWGFGFTYYDPWWGYGWHPHWGPTWRPGWHDHYYPGWGPGHGSGRPYASNIVRRPNPYTSPSGGRHFGSQAGSGSSSTYNRGGSRFDFGVRNSGSSGSSSGTRNGATYNRGSGSSNSSSGYRNNRGGSTTFNRGSSSSYDRGNSGSSSSYDRGSSSSFNRGSSSSSSSGSYGGSYGGSSSGGSSSGGSSGGGSVGGRNAGGR